MEADHLWMTNISVSAWEHPLFLHWGLAVCDGTSSHDWNSQNLPRPQWYTHHLHWWQEWRICPQSSKHSQYRCMPWKNIIIRGLHHGVKHSKVQILSDHSDVFVQKTLLNLKIILFLYRRHHYKCDHSDDCQLVVPTVHMQVSFTVWSCALFFF